MEEKLQKYLGLFFIKIQNLSRNDGFVVDDDDGNTFGNSFRFHKIQTSGHGISKSITAVNK